MHFHSEIMKTMLKLVNFEKMLSLIFLNYVLIIFVCFPICLNSHEESDQYSTLSESSTKNSVICKNTR